MRTASLLAPIVGVSVGLLGGRDGSFTVFADPGEYEFHSCERCATEPTSLKAGERRN